MVDRPTATANRLFLERHGIGSHVTRADLIKFATDLTTGINGYEVDYSLATGVHYAKYDEKKAANRIRSDIVSGGDGYVIVPVDSKAGLYLVQATAQFRLDQASPTAAINRAGNAVVANIRVRKGLDEIDVDELSDTDREKHGIRKDTLDQIITTGRQNVIALSEGYQMTAYRHAGLTEAQIKKILPLQPDMETLSRVQRRIGSN